MSPQDEQVRRNAMRCIVMALRASGPLTVNEMWDELLNQCAGVHQMNVDRVRQVRSRSLSGGTSSSVQRRRQLVGYPSEDVRREPEVQRIGDAVKRLRCLWPRPVRSRRVRSHGARARTVCLVRPDTPASSHLRVGPGRPNPVHEC